MAIADLRIKHVFPKIPLNLTLSEGYPDVGNISSVSVVPEMKHIRVGRNELELEGSYSLSVSYFGAQPEASSVQSGDKDRADEFFGFLKVQSNGFLNEDDSDYPGVEESSGDLYTVDFSRPFHTYVDLRDIDRSRNFKPVMVVEKVNVSGHGPRIIKGELVLGVVNIGRERRR